MNYPVICRILSVLVLLLAGVLLVCEAYGYFVERVQLGTSHDFALLKSFALALGIGVVLGWLGRGSSREVMRKEGIAIVGLAWILCTLVGATPYVLCQPGLPLAAAVFESASGFTTTGSTVIADLDEFPRSILLWRSTTQWLGGMGILVLFVALLSTLGVGSKALFRFESSAQIGYGFYARIRETAIRLWQLYAALTVLSVVGLMVLGMSFYDALLHSFSAISTGGFSPRNESIGFYSSPAIEWWLVLIMVLGGTSFLLMAWVLRGNWKKASSDEELRMYLLLLFVGTLAITLDLSLRRDGLWFDNLRSAAFQVTSMMTTTGFATADFDLWPTLSKTILVLLMFVGGSAGSTSGAIKVSRFVIFAKSIRQQILNAFRPSHVIPLRMNGQVLPPDTATSAVFFIALTLVIFAVGVLAITLLEPNLNLVSAATSVTATLLNIGPGLDAVGPTRNFAEFGAPSLLILSALMLLGRLELFAVLVLFVPSLWKKY